MHKNKKRKGDDEESMEVDPVAGPSGINNIAMSNGDQNGLVHDDMDHLSEDEEGGVRIGDIYIPPKPPLVTNSTDSRFIITHIVNENFKSYAGVETLGPFHKRFTSIIGPNGSGKSNVIDSMLFVFGYRASKIRSKKISVLIHSSSKFPNINSANVAVHFCEIRDKEGEDDEVVPGSEVVVSRTAFRDNSSFYTLNGRRVQFKEVAKVLRAHGIDLDHNRFLILQGEVEQIALMKAKGQNEHDIGMLEYLEDIIGTSRYKMPIDQLSVKVDELSEARKDKLNRVRLVEMEKHQLEQPMVLAVQQMNHTNAALRTRNMLLQKYIHESNKLIEKRNEELEQLKANLRDIDEKLTTLQGKLSEKTNILNEGMKKYDVLQKKRDERKEKLQSIKKKSVMVQADTTHATKKKKNLEQLLEQEKGKLIEFELIPEKNRRDIDDCKKLLEKHQENKNQVEKQFQTAMAGVRSKTQGLQGTKDKLQAKLIDLKKIVDESNKKFKLAESELKIYLSTEVKENETLANLHEAYERAERDFGERKRQQTELSGTLPKNEKQLSEAQTKLQALKNEETTVASSARVLRSKVEESKQAMNANRSRGRVLDALMKEKSRGRLPGIFGRLGDLGGIDVKYDVAISTCCAALDNIVVDTVDTAQACVEHLKRHDIGRATFIALDKQEHLKGQYARRVTYPEKVPRLFDLVKVKDQRVLPAFYYALRDTLVAANLEQASRIAYGSVRYRVVSLNGDVIETAGTMSGGGRSTIRGRMSSSVQQETTDHDPGVIRAQEEKLARMEHKLSELRSQQTTLEDSVISLQRSTQEGKITINKINIELNSLKEQIPILKKQIKQQELKVKSCKVDERQKQTLENAMREAEKNLEKAQKNAGKIEEEVQAVDVQIEAVAGGKVKDLQKNIDDLTKKIDKVSNEMTKLQVAINSSVRNAKKCKDKLIQMESDFRDTERNLETLANQKKQYTLESSLLTKELEEIEEEINEGSNEFTELKEEIKKIQSKETKLKSARLEANNEVVKMEKTIQEIRAKAPMWERELQNLVLEDPGIEGVTGIERPEPLARHTPEELEAASVEELRNRLALQKGKLTETKPNVQAIQDYKAKEELYLRRVAELEQITTTRNELRILYDQLLKKRNTEFLQGFTTITTKLKEMYQMITLGGDAELELVDSLNPFTEGITFSVRPPNKSWKNISNLSGGEKTLSSLALVFALHYYKPTPLYVMDEIDAALDFKNVSIVAHYIKEKTGNAQFIIISLRYNMFEVSDRLVGIYKTEDCTKSVTIENKPPADLKLKSNSPNAELNGRPRSVDAQELQENNV